MSIPHYILKTTDQPNLRNLPLIHMFLKQKRFDRNHLQRCVLVSMARFFTPWKSFHYKSFIKTSDQPNLHKLA